jgi:dihydroxyacetone kinase-like protein
VVVEKIVGAAAEAGADLAACQALGERVVRATGAMGVALTSCTVPAAGRTTFEIGPGEMGMCVGIHGEPGRRRVPVAPAEAIAEEMIAAICQAIGPRHGAPLLLLVNGFGATPLMELYLMHGAARRLCEARGLPVARSLVGHWATSPDMAGCSLSLTRLDDELIRLWGAPVHTPALRCGR